MLYLIVFLGKVPLVSIHRHQQQQNVIHCLSLYPLYIRLWELFPEVNHLSLPRVQNSEAKPTAIRSQAWKISSAGFEIELPRARRDD